MGLPMMAARAVVHSAENQARIRQVANGAGNANAAAGGPQAASRPGCPPTVTPS